MRFLSSILTPVRSPDRAYHVSQLPVAQHQRQPTTRPSTTSIAGLERPSTSCINRKSTLIKLMASLAGMLLLLALGRPVAAQNPGSFVIGAPGGQIIAFNLDATNGYNLAPFDGAATCNGPDQASAASVPSVAQDGTIAFSRRDPTDGTNGRRVFLMDGDGSNVRQITFIDATLAEDLFPRISPDGTKVAFISKRADGQHQEVFVVNSDGTGLRQVTEVGPSGQTADSVAWSPDSTTLAFIGDRFSTVCNPSAPPQNYHLVGTISLGENPGPETHLACAINNALDWSPDGNLIAHSSSTITAEPAINVIEPVSGALRHQLTLTQLGTVCGQPHCIHFSPDSTRLAYQSAGAFNGISIINLDGTGRVDSANLGGFSPDNFWWKPGPAIPAATQLTLAPDPVVVWPGKTRQLIPSLLDASNNVIAHSVQGYCKVGPVCESIDAASLVSFLNTNSPSSLFVANAGLTSNAVTVSCLAQDPCAFMINPSAQNFTSAGGSDSVSVLVSATGAPENACDWTATSNDGFITITSGASGAGDGTVNYSVAANAGAQRMGTMTIAGQTFTVTQDSLPPSADLNVSKTDSPDPVTVESNLTYTITVMNNGPDLANGVTMTDTLPAGVTFVSATPTQGSCAGTSTVSCNLGSLANGGSATVTIVVTPTQAGVISNTASVAATETDPNRGNNSATQTTTVNSANLPDLTGSWQSVAQKCTGPGGSNCRITGNFTVVNQGNANAGAFMVNFYLSTDNSFDVVGDTLLRQVNVNGLMSGQQKKINLSAPLPSGTSAVGKFVIAVIDANNSVNETNEGNNIIASSQIP